jgi:hypothetical protein
MTIDKGALLVTSSFQLAGNWKSRHTHRPGSTFVGKAKTMTAHCATPSTPAVYKSASSRDLLAAFMAPFKVLHDIQWNAPWDRAGPTPRAARED